MAIKIMDATATHRHEIDGSVFIYKEIPGNTLARLEDKAFQSRNGVNSMKAGTLSMQILEWGVIGWENVVGPAGEEEYSKEKLELLPTEIRDTLIGLIRGRDDELTEEQAKN